MTAKTGGEGWQVPDYWWPPEKAIANAATWKAPEYWPQDRDGLMRLLCDAARVYGCRVALGELITDDAYTEVRNMLEIATIFSNAVSVAHDFSFLAWNIDRWTDIAGAYVAQQDNSAFRLMKRAASAEIARGAVGSQVRAAIVQTALSCPLPPQEELLHEALQSAIAEARGNERWMRQRELTGANL